MRVDLSKVKPQPLPTWDRTGSYLPGWYEVWVQLTPQSAYLLQDSSNRLKRAKQRAEQFVLDGAYSAKVQTRGTLDVLHRVTEPPIDPTGMPHEPVVPLAQPIGEENEE